MSVIRLKQCAHNGCDREFPDHYIDNYCADHRRYSAQDLPQLVPDSKGIALPRPSVSVAACCVPADTPWGQEMMRLREKHWHVCADTNGYHYPDDEFDRFYEISRELDPTSEPRAKFLSDYWQRRGHSVKVFEATKTKPAHVVGVANQSGVFENVEGTTPFKSGDVILESPEITGRMWVIKKATFEKKYQGIQSAS